FGFDDTVSRYLNDRHSRKLGYVLICESLDRAGPARFQPSAVSAATTQEDQAMAVITGTVKFFNPTKGYGFISPQGGGKAAFVHTTAMQRSGLQGLYENDKVT